MKYEHLTGYAKFLLLSDTARGLGSHMQAYISFNQIIKILEECCKSDTPTLIWKNKIVEKPITRMEAIAVLDKVQNNIWDNSIRRIANIFEIELR
jgi:hypothetical protein|tara:strand:+ start:1019 stop:1303 length:285 start_codon:yes stop_codon:yes gene_type:complete